MMTFEEAFKIATRVKNELEPHCYRCEIAGSIRRQKTEGIKDIEIVCIPKPFDFGLFESGIATVVNRWEKVKGDMRPTTKYTQRILPEGVKLDLFIANEINWGYIYTIRTGSQEFSRKLAYTWVKQGYRGKDGYLTKDGEIIPVYEEEDLFKLLGLKYVHPIFR
jgi:DNA polymerase/3'-5' exonuclease PolX